MNKKKAIVKALLDGPKTFTEILESTGLTRPTLSNHLKKLEEEGVVQSVLDRKDKRKILYMLSEESIGLTTVSKAIEIIEKELGERLDDEERERLKEILTKYVKELIIIALKHDLDVENAERVIKMCISAFVTFNELLKGFYKRSGMPKQEARQIFIKSSLQFVEDEKGERGFEIILEASENLPDSFIKKWKRTNFFRKELIASFSSFATIGELMAKGGG